MSDKTGRLFDAVRAANEDRVQRLAATASHRRTRFIAAAQSAPPSRSWLRWWVASAAGLAAVAAVVALVWMRPAALSFDIDGEAGEPGAAVVARDQPVNLAFTDGTTLRGEPGTRFSVTSDADGADIALESGVVALNVRKRPGARWSVAAGPYTVRVIGTQFSVDWAPDGGRLSVQVTEGTVKVEGPDGVHTLHGGDGVIIGEEAVAEAAGVVEPDPPVPSSAEGGVEIPQPEAVESTGSDTPTHADRVRQPGKASRTGVKRAKPQWAVLAAAGQYGEAFERASEGGFAKRCADASAAQLAELADIARFAKKTSAARQALTDLRARFPKTTAGKQAAYRLGRLEFEQARRYGEAARWFGTYLAEHPSSALAAAAHGRLIESYDRNGNAAKARQEARPYLELHPKGAHADVAQRVAK